MSNFRRTYGMARLTFLIHGCNRILETFAPAFEASEENVVAWKI